LGLGVFLTPRCFFVAPAWGECDEIGFRRCKVREIFWCWGLRAHAVACRLVVKRSLAGDIVDGRSVKRWGFFPLRFVKMRGKLVMLRRQQSPIVARNIPRIGTIGKVT
jgi:hypothetical protein